MYTKEQIDILLADAKSGDTDAQNSIGCAYGQGDGVERNFQTAFSWFMRSAEQGNMYAQYNVGLYYRYGKGVKKDIHLAVQWYEKSASSGYAEAAYALGEIYEKEIPANVQEAFYWYRKATAHHEMARYNLARCYELGIGTGISLHKAIDLYRHCQKEAKSLADKRIEQMKTSYDYLKDTRIRNIELFSDNPFRILGVYSNEGIRAERASHSRMLALAKVGKFPASSVDNFIPCTTTQYALFWKNRLDVKEIPDKYLSGLTSTAAEIDEIIRIYRGTIAKELYADWCNFENTNQQWNDLPKRKETDINKAADKLTIDTERIKYSLFWFCCVTEEDKKAFRLLAEQKWYDAVLIWENCDNFSALINTSVLLWLERKDRQALKTILEVITDDDYREEFLSNVCKNNSEITETELRHIFWDALFQFPESELTESLSWPELVKSCDLSSYYLGKDDLNYIEEKHLSKLKKPLVESLHTAEMKDKDNFDECIKAYDEIIRIAPYNLLCIKRFVGENDYRYKMICNDIASKMLHYAIYHNNNNKAWHSPATSLRLAQYAAKIAVDPALKKRCEDNVKIFAENKKIATSEQILEKIENAFSVAENGVVSTFEPIKELIKDSQLYLDCLKTELTKESTEFQKISNNVVNRIINIIIQRCNKIRDFHSASSGLECLKQLKAFTMNTQTLNRINTNIKTLQNNSQAALMKGGIGLPKPKQKSYKETMSKSEIKRRRKNKLKATVFSIVSMVVICYFLFNDYNYLINNLKYLWYIGFTAIVILAIYVISMWELELKNDPFDSEIEWLNKTTESLFDVYNFMMSLSWPLAFPFGFLGLALLLISFPIKWITKFATLIK